MNFNTKDTGIISRIDERTIALSKAIDEIKQEVLSVNLKLDSNYATKEWIDSKYGPTRTVVFFILAIFTTAIVGFFANLVIKK